MATYTTILHQARKKLGLSLNEYAVADIIYHLQNNPDSQHPGWCYASKETIGDDIGIGRRGIHKIILRLIELGYLEKDNYSTHLRITPSWYNIVISDKSEFNAQVGTKFSQSGNKVPKDSEQSSHYNNSTNNNIINNTHSLDFLENIPSNVISEFTSKYNISARQLKEKGEELADYCRMHGRKYSNYKAFLSNAVRKEYSKRIAPSPKPWDIKPQPHIELPEEKRIENLQKMSLIKSNIGVIK